MVDTAKIWNALAGAYGNNWLAMWRGMERATVEQNMAELFAGLQDWQVDYALQHLPDRTPSLPAFRKLAESAPAGGGLEDGMEWVWVPLPLDGAPAIGQPTMKPRKLPIGSGYQPLYGERQKDEKPLTLAQRARSMAYMAQTWAALGYTENADKARAQCAELVELARDAGEQTPTAAALQDEAERDFAAARARQRAEEMHGLTEPQRPQFDLAALLARRGTKDEHPRDWARIIAAKVERGGQVSDYAVKKARDALKDYEGERWLQSRARPQTVLATPAPMRAAESVPSARFDDAEVLPW